LPVKNDLPRAGQGKTFFLGKGALNLGRGSEGKKGIKEARGAERRRQGGVCHTAIKKEAGMNHIKQKTEKVRRHF